MKDSDRDVPVTSDALLSVAAVRALLGLGPNPIAGPGVRLPGAVTSAAAAAIRANISRDAFWTAAYAEPVARPLLLLLQLPEILALPAWPVAAATFPTFPVTLSPVLEAGETRVHWEREDNHLFSRWDTEDWRPPRPTSLAMVMGNGLRGRLHRRRQPCALLWRDVCKTVVPVAAGALGRVRPSAPPRSPHSTR